MIFAFESFHSFFSSKVIIDNQDIGFDFTVILSYFRKLANKILDVQDPDYYEWTTHIFFDDCMEPDDSGDEMQV